MVRHPRDSDIVIPIALWSGHTRKQSNSLALSSISKNVGTNGAEVRLTSGSLKDPVHPSCDWPNSRGPSRLVQAMSAWSVKTRRAPSRHSRDARVYGHTTTAIHKLSTPPPPHQAVDGAVIVFFLSLL